MLHDYLDDLTKEIEGVRQAQDIEYVHRMRVATRRLRSALPLFSECFPQKKYPDWFRSIKQVTKALGLARDLDVQIDLLGNFQNESPEPAFRAGINRLLLRLRQRRTKAQKKVNRALDRLEASATIPGLSRRLEPFEERQNQTYLYTPALYKRGYDSIMEKMQNYLGYSDCVEQPDKVEELHAMRIAAKHLRYTMEIFASLYPGELKDTIQVARKAQDLLGAVHDCDVWTSFLPEFLKEERCRIIEFYGNQHGYSPLVPGIRAFLENRKAERDQSYQEFVHHWNQQKNKHTWENLAQTIQMPYNRIEPQPAVQEPQVEKKEEQI